MCWDHCLLDSPLKDFPLPILLIKTKSICVLTRFSKFDKEFLLSDWIAPVAVNRHLGGERPFWLHNHYGLGVQALARLGVGFLEVAGHVLTSKSVRRLCLSVG
jgi:hypothetical protein